MSDPKHFIVPLRFDEDHFFAGIQHDNFTVTPLVSIIEKLRAEHQPREVMMRALDCPALLLDGKCDCGADEHNAIVDTVIWAVKELMND